MLHVCNFIIISNFFFFDVSTQEKGEEGFELVIFASLGVVQLDYSLGTISNHIDSYMIYHRCKN
jgi:hypothetical protein